MLPWTLRRKRQVYYFLTSGKQENIFVDEFRELFSDDPLLYCLQAPKIWRCFPYNINLDNTLGCSFKARWFSSSMTSVQFSSTDGD
jgi:hypothetical protein